MYALHMAVSAIRNGDCDGAIVAAGNWISDPAMQFLLDKLGALSPTSRCHTFDAAADGYARGEGFAALYLKKSDLAVLEGTPELPIITVTGYVTLTPDLAIKVVNALSMVIKQLTGNPQKPQAQTPH